MKRGKLCRAGMHDDWSRRKPAENEDRESYWSCNPCRRASNNRAQKAYAERLGEDFKRRDRARHKRKRWAKEEMRCKTD